MQCYSCSCGYSSRCDSKWVVCWISCDLVPSFTNCMWRATHFLHQPKASALSASFLTLFPHGRQCERPFLCAACRAGCVSAHHRTIHPCPRWSVPSTGLSSGVVRSGDPDHVTLVTPCEICILWCAGAGSASRSGVVRNCDSDHVMLVTSCEICTLWCPGATVDPRA